MKKKYLALLLTGVLGVSALMTACGNKEVTPSTEDSVVSTEESTVEDESTEDVVVEDSTVVEDEVTEETPDVEDGEDVEGEEGEIAGPVIEDETIAAIFDAVKAELGENYFPNMPLDGEFLEGIYGVPAGSYDTFYGEAPMISANVDTLLVVKPAEGQMEAVLNALTTYRQGLVDDTFQYPKNIPVIQNSEVYTAGDYVVYMCLAGDTMVNDEPTDEDIANVAKATMEKAKAALATVVE